ncbi:uncharacterized protein [Primulina eburnea]|uniref:uncharacterized protein isoform X1 n=1 Tax=Primulina eburnea TaxID=1245227 RepID=UPI003C6C098A
MCGFSPSFFFPSLSNPFFSHSFRCPARTLLSFSPASIQLTPTSFCRLARVSVSSSTFPRLGKRYFGFKNNGLHSAYSLPSSLLHFAKRYLGLRFTDCRFARKNKREIARSISVAYKGRFQQEMEQSPFQFQCYYNFLFEKEVEELMKRLFSNPVWAIIFRRALNMESKLFFFSNRLCSRYRDRTKSQYYPPISECTLSK